MKPVLFGELVKVTGGDPAQRKAVAGRFAHYIGLDAKQLSLYGDEYVAYKAPWDSEAEQQRVADLLFKHKIVMGGAYDLTRGVTDLKAKQTIIDDLFESYREAPFEGLLENPTELDVVQLTSDLDRDYPETPKEV